jgi:hypothetical protein
MCNNEIVKRILLQLACPISHCSAVFIRPGPPPPWLLAQHTTRMWGEYKRHRAPKCAPRPSALTPVTYKEDVNNTHKKCEGTWFVLNTDNIWYGHLKLLFTTSVKIDGKEEPVDMECACVSFCYEIKLEPSGMY